MAVRVIDKTSGNTVTGKFAVVKADNVFLYSGIMLDKKGLPRGCGKKAVFPSETVTVDADDPERELKVF